MPDPPHGRTDHSHGRTEPLKELAGDHEPIGEPHSGVSGGSDTTTSIKLEVEGHANDRTAEIVNQIDQSIDTTLENLHHTEQDDDVDDPLHSAHPVSQTQPTNLGPSHLAAEMLKKAKVVTDAYCTKLHPTENKYGSASPDFLKNGFVISAKEAEALLNDPVLNNDVGVLDLRDNNPILSASELYAKKIPGAMELPIAENNSKLVVSLADSTKDVNLDRQREWNKLLQVEPLRSLILKPVVIIHCVHGVNRTPIIGSGYRRYVAGPKGQSVVLLKGGFQQYVAEAKPEHGKPELIVDKHFTTHVFE